MFRCEFLDAKWLTVLLENATKVQHLQRISIHVSSRLSRASAMEGSTVQAEEEQAHALQVGLDPLLVQFWESHSIRTKILYNIWHPSHNPRHRGGGTADWLKYLLPESTKRGAIDPVEE